MAIIREVKARQILNSAGEPAVEVKVILENEKVFVGSAPAGISRGSREATEVTDKDFARFQGREMKNAVEKINEVVRPEIKGTNPIEQGLIDRKLIDLDGTPNKAHLGVNAILPVSIAVAKAGAFNAKKHLFHHLNSYFNDLIVEEGDFEVGVTNYPYQLPLPIFNMLEGGKHAQNSVPIQEFWFVPQGTIGNNFWEKLRIGAEAFFYLRQLLQGKNLNTNYGEEGGFAPSLNSIEQGLELLIEAGIKTRAKPGVDFLLGIDAAGAQLAVEDQSQYYQDLVKKYPLRLLEDPFGENDWERWINFHRNILEEVVVIGDDLTVTNPTLVAQAIRYQAISGLIIKPNQIGTVTEVLRVAKLAKTKGLKLIVSHRSKETNDDFIADLAVAVGADYIKSGAPVRGERVAKYNRLLEIDSLVVK